MFFVICYVPLLLYVMLQVKFVFKQKCCKIKKDGGQAPHSRYILRRSRPRLSVVPSLNRHDQNQSSNHVLPLAMQGHHKAVPLSTGHTRVATSRLQLDSPVYHH